MKPPAGNVSNPSGGRRVSPAGLWQGETRASPGRLLLLGLIPLVQPGLRFLAGLLRRDTAVDHARAQPPQLVLQVRLAAREDLVRVADGRLAGTAPAQKLLG